MSQDTKSDDLVATLAPDDSSEEIQGYVEDYDDAPEELTEAQAETDDGVPQDADSDTENATEDGDEGEPEEKEESKEESESERLAKLQHAIKVQAYENRELKRKFRELEEARKKAEEQGVSQKAEEPAGAPKVPKPEDPGIEYDDEKFAKALEEYHQKAAAYYRQQEVEKEKRSKEEQAHQERVNTFVESSQKLQEQDPVYAELVQATSSVRFSEAITEALLSSKNPGELHRSLISDPDKLEQINSMSPYSALRELISMENGLSAQATKSAPQKKVSNAPDPVRLSRGISSPPKGVPAGYKEDY